MTRYACPISIYILHVYIFGNDMIVTQHVILKHSV